MYYAHIPIPFSLFSDAYATLLSKLDSLTGPCSKEELNAIATTVQFLKQRTPEDGVTRLPAILQPIEVKTDLLFTIGGHNGKDWTQDAGFISPDGQGDPVPRRLEVGAIRPFPAEGSVHLWAGLVPGK